MDQVAVFDVKVHDPVHLPKRNQSMEARSERSQRLQSAGCLNNNRDECVLQCSEERRAAGAPLLARVLQSSTWDQHQHWRAAAASQTPDLQFPEMQQRWCGGGLFRVARLAALQ